MENELVIQKATPATLLEKAIERGVDITQLKELMDLQDRWEKKEAKKRFLEAKSLFLSKVPIIKKNKTAKVTMKTGGSYSYKYAELGSITTQIKKSMHECGLSYGYTFAEKNGKIEVSCALSHLDGHTEITTMDAAADASGGKNDIQQKGSTITYLERYTLLGALGLSTADEDNDARGHSQPKEEQSEEEIMDHWRQSVGQVKNRVELQALYLKNKKTVEGDSKIQAIFKDRQDALKKLEPAKKPSPENAMP